MNKKNIKYFLNINLFLLFTFFIGCSSTQKIENQNSSQPEKSSWINLDTVKAGRFDLGKMWTFDYPPKEYFAQEYNFSPSDDWLNNVRMSALRFATYCSASFVSEDGLVMTNHHCARESVTEVSKEGEDLHTNGFYATTLEEERKVPGLFVDQLVLIKDVTKEVQSAIDSGKTESEKVANKNRKIDELQNKYKEETGLEISVVTLYQGGKYSVYGYKRYNDVRLVFAPETQMGFFGGDYDNFTYPRYDLDCSFFRVYDEDGKPLKTKNYFKWNPNGAKPGEAVFVVGNPGRTNRLYTIAQLEYQRDYSYPITLEMLNGFVDVYSKVIDENPERAFELQDRLFGFSNSQKVYVGLLAGLRDPVLLQRKKDFEKKFQTAVNAKPELRSKYGNLWNLIATNKNEAKKYVFQNAAYTINPFSSTQYFLIAKDIIKLAEALKLPEEQRTPEYKSDMLDSTIAEIFPDSFDYSLNDKMLAFNIKFLSMLLGEDNPLILKFTSGKKGEEAVKYCLTNSQITTKEKVNTLLKKSPDEILNSNDPFIYYIMQTRDLQKEYSAKMKEINDKETAYLELLGRALFEVYGTSIPPDATFTLRLADGVVAGYNYNGTKAPTNTTFYGLYDRFYSFNKEYPWSLPERWQNPPPEFDLETPFNFVSTNDIVGGNSGSPIINKKAEIIGLAFDGNIESLPSTFIFATELNRTVGVHSAGIYEAVKDMYQAKRLADELLNGKISE